MGGIVLIADLAGNRAARKPRSAPRLIAGTGAPAGRQLVRQALVLDGKFQHTRSIAGPSLGICQPFEMVRPFRDSVSPGHP